MGPRRRRSVRLPGFDYSSPGAYFVTVCTRDRACVFGEVINEAVEPSLLGQRTIPCWEAIPDHFPHVELDAWILMPNHIHGILILKEGDRRGVQHLPWRAVPGLNAPTPQVENPRMGSISPQAHSLPVVIRTFKAAVTTEAKRAQLKVPIWQRGYYEHVIRGDAQLAKARRYVSTNPTRWLLDRENSKHKMEAASEPPPRKTSSPQLPPSLPPPLPPPGLPLPDADAQRRQSIEGALLLRRPAAHFVQQRADDPRPRATQRMPQSNRSAIDVRDLVAQAQFLHDRQGLHGEGLVQLDQPDLLDAKTGPLEGFARRRDWPVSHCARLNSGRGRGDHPGPRP